jgi:hypothetical protein
VLFCLRMRSLLLTGNLNKHGLSCKGQIALFSVLCLFDLPHSVNCSSVQCTLSVLLHTVADFVSSVRACESDADQWNAWLSVWCWQPCHWQPEYCPSRYIRFSAVEFLTVNWQLYIQLFLLVTTNDDRKYQRLSQYLYSSLFSTQLCSHLQIM